MTTIQFQILNHSYVYDYGKERFNVVMTDNPQLDAIGDLYASIMNDRIREIRSYLPLEAAVTEYITMLFPRWPLSFVTPDPTSETNLSNSDTLSTGDGKIY